MGGAAPRRQAARGDARKGGVAGVCCGRAGAVAERLPVALADPVLLTDLSTVDQVGAQ